MWLSPDTIRRFLADGLLGSDRVLEFLRGAESDLLAGLDLNDRAGPGVAPRPGRTVLHLEGAQAADPNPLTGLEVSDEHLDHAGHDGVDLFFSMACRSASLAESCFSVTVGSAAGFAFRGTELAGAAIGAAFVAVFAPLAPDFGSVFLAAMTDGPLVSFEGRNHDPSYNTRFLKDRYAVVADCPRGVSASMTV